MKIGQSSPLFREYQALFPGSERLQKRLCGYHASLIKCCSHIVVVVQRSGRSATYTGLPFACLTRLKWPQLY